jgi:hypothetical protein
MMNVPFLKTILPGCATLSILAGVFTERSLFRTAPVDSAPYHARISAAAEEVPLHIGSWLGAETPVPAAAIQILHPNVIISRRYVNLSTGSGVSFLLVQVRDARDILGHYPPVCYAGQGWTRDASQPVDWQLDDQEIHGTRYLFSSERSDRRSEIVVDNALFLPDGTTCRDMDGVDASARNNRLKFFGAAQVQVVYDSAVPAAERHVLFETFMRVARPVVEQLRMGVPR